MVVPDYVTIKLYADTRRLLRLIAAESGEQMVQVMQRLCEAEWQRLTKLNVATNVAQDSTTSTAPQPNAE